jgi:fatty acid desaturase
MDDMPPDQPPHRLTADFNPDRPAKSRQGRRLQRIREEIERNRTEGPTVPTWVLAVALVVIIGAFLTVVIVS